LPKPKIIEFGIIEILTWCIPDKIQNTFCTTTILGTKIADFYLPSLNDNGLSGLPCKPSDSLERIV
jgi:hypothetical protein